MDETANGREAADEQEKADAHIRVTPSQKRKLRSRARADENAYHDVVERLLSETREVTDLTDVLEDIGDYYDEIAAIKAEVVPAPSNPSGVMLTTYTPEAETFDDTPPIYNGGEHYARIHTEGETLELSLDLIATFDGPPGMEMASSVVVYRSDSILGAEPRSIETGLERLREMLSEGELER